MSDRSPFGYVRLATPDATAVAHHACADALLHILASGRAKTVYEWAAAHAQRTVQGRRPVHFATLPLGGPAVAVRRNHHGGLLASLRGDRFFAYFVRPELRISATLRRLRVPAAEVLAQIEYPVNRFDRRVDVVTRQLPAGLDFGAAITATDTPPELREARWVAVAYLLTTLAIAGVWHRDLNVRNIYLMEDDPEVPPVAALLDVDRVSFHTPGAIVAAANRRRLVRSLRKWKTLHHADVAEADIAGLVAATEGAL